MIGDVATIDITIEAFKYFERPVGLPFLQNQVL